jgi:error-prone DNA polymerase
MKRHHPAAFSCALLNSQPMGFYQPAQLMQDARRHGVKVLPVDVRYSDWDCALERGGQKKEKRGQSPFSRKQLLYRPTSQKKGSDPFLPALRLGLRMIKGMREDAAHRIAAARAEHPFRDVQDLAGRAALDRHDLAVLAEAAALRGLAGHRHRARWEIAAVERGQSKVPEQSALALYSDPNADPVSIRPPTEVDDVRADYASTGLTLGRHPLALLRRILRHRRAMTASELQQQPHGSRVRACGLVTMRQRPMTASGTVFLTLEDETGYVNAVIWSRLFERQRAEILGANLLAIDGTVETDGDVHHLIADRVHDFSHLAGSLRSKSRDFC